MRALGVVFHQVATFRFKDEEEIKSNFSRYSPKNRELKQ